MSGETLLTHPSHTRPACPACGHDLWLTLMDHDAKKQTRHFRCPRCKTESDQPAFKNDVVTSDSASASASAKASNRDQGRR